MDLSKVPNSVCYNKLIKSLFKIGIKDKGLILFKSHWINRTHKVKIGDVLSQSKSSWFCLSI